MKATVILGDYARVVDGKLDVLGGGWTLGGPGPVSMGVGVIIEIPWDQRDGAHTLRLGLYDADGRQVQFAQPDGTTAGLEIQTEFQLATTEGHVEGVPVPFAIAVNVPNLPLPPAQRFEWWLHVDGTTQLGWRVAFATRES